MSSEWLPLARPRLHRSEFTGELLSLLFFLVAIYVLLELAIPRSIVQSVSMEPSLFEDQRLLISRVSYLLGNPRRGDILVFEPPGHQPGDPPLIKRLIGLPGEFIEFRDQAVYINGHQLVEPYINEPCLPVRCEDASWQLGANQFFVMGDNRNHSRDSRTFGPITRQQLVGQAVLRWWPVSAWSVLSYSYGPVPR